MPYIKTYERGKYDVVIEDLVDALTDRKTKLPPPGDINYILSSALWRIWNQQPSYTTGNMIVGVLECVKQEFFRRKLNLYEDEKLSENGDLKSKWQ
jgi:hypothetical protein